MEMLTLLGPFRILAEHVNLASTIYRPSFLVAGAVLGSKEFSWPQPWDSVP